jgi:tRNA-dihydrouridine synthase B
MKQFACWFSHGVGNGSELRRTVHAARTQQEVLDSVEHFFEQQAAVTVPQSAQAQRGPRSSGLQA